MIPDPLRARLWVVFPRDAASLPCGCCCVGIVHDASIVEQAHSIFYILQQYSTLTSLGERGRAVEAVAWC